MTPEPDVSGASTGTTSDGQAADRPAPGTRAEAARAEAAGAASGRAESSDGTSGQPGGEADGPSAHIGVGEGAVPVWGEEGAAATRSWGQGVTEADNGWTANAPSTAEGWTTDNPATRDGWTTNDSAPQSGWGSNAPPGGWGSHDTTPQDGWGSQEASARESWGLGGGSADDGGGSADSTWGGERSAAGAWSSGGWGPGDEAGQGAWSRVPDGVADLARPTRARKSRRASRDTEDDGPIWRFEPTSRSPWSSNATTSDHAPEPPATTEPREVTEPRAAAQPWGDTSEPRAAVAEPRAAIPPSEDASESRVDSIEPAVAATSRPSASSVGHAASTGTPSKTQPRRAGPSPREQSALGESPATGERPTPEHISGGDSPTSEGVSQGGWPTPEGVSAGGWPTSGGVFEGSSEHSSSPNTSDEGGDRPQADSGHPQTPDALPTASEGRLPDAPRLRTDHRERQAAELGRDAELRGRGTEGAGRGIDRRGNEAGGHGRDADHPGASRDWGAWPDVTRRTSRPKRKVRERASGVEGEWAIPEGGLGSGDDGGRSHGWLDSGDDGGGPYSGLASGDDGDRPQRGLASGDDGSTTRRRPRRATRRANTSPRDVGDPFDSTGEPPEWARDHAAPTGRPADHRGSSWAAPSGQPADQAQGYAGAPTGQPSDHSQGYSAASKRQHEDDSRRYEDSAPTTGLFSDGPEGYGSREGDEGSGGEGSRERRRSGGRRGGGGARRGSSRRRSGGPDGPDEGSGAASGPPANPESVARAICLRLLTMGPKTRAQLAEALRKREVPDEAADAVLDRFTELGLINDEAFAEAWVDSRHHGRGLARRALAAELRHRGVDSDTVNEAVERVDSDQEADTARRLVERKLASTRGLDAQVRTRRLAGMLARKGYGAGLAYRVVREALESEGVEIENDFP
ncbi:recombination regulator RecX [Nonomuraea recticatena]